MFGVFRLLSNQYRQSKNKKDESQCDMDKKMGKREVWVRLASVVPKRNIGLMTHCYVRVGQVPIVPKCNSGSIIHCYIWVGLLPIVSLCDKLTLLPCCVWLRQMVIVLFTFGVSMATFRYDPENNIFIVF